MHISQSGKDFLVKLILLCYTVSKQMIPSVRRDMEGVTNVQQSIQCCDSWY